MFGDNDDIPAYRWYDKEQTEALRLRHGRHRAQRPLRPRPGPHAPRLQHHEHDGRRRREVAVYHGQHVGRQRGGEEAPRRRRGPADAQPLLPERTLVALLLGRRAASCGKRWQQKRKTCSPRLNRLEHGYPFVRAAMCVLMRDISANLAILDMLRGAPSIYMLYLGYDEVAHHSGPWTGDAFGDLKRLDKTFARLRRVIKEKAPRPYELDHPVRPRPVLRRHLQAALRPDHQGVHRAADAPGHHRRPGDRRRHGRHRPAGRGRRAGQRAAAGQGNAVSRRAWPSGGRSWPPRAARRCRRARRASAAAPALGDRLRQRQRRPGLLRPLPAQDHARANSTPPTPAWWTPWWQHEGIGMVIGYADDMTAVVLGKGGRRNLHTGEVVGEDPVAPYAPATGPRRRRARDARLAAAPGDGLPQRRRPLADQHHLPRRHRGRAGGAGRQPWRRGRRADGRLYLPPARHGGA